MVRFVEDGGETGDGLAPVIPLFPAGTEADARSGRPRARVAFAPADESDDGSQDADDVAGRERPHSVPADSTGAAAVAVAAEKALVRKLAAREMSVSEARAFLVSREAAADDVERIVNEFVERRYLDDARLAEQIVRIGLERKGQGRQVIAMTLSSRGVPRDVGDAALDALPDDEGERALEFARDRARRMDGVDETAALRRLLGQLARRGFSGHAATEAARTALAERGGGRSSGVRFS